MQMKKKRVRANTIIPSVLRIVNERDIERLEEVRKGTMTKAESLRNTRPTNENR